MFSAILITGGIGTMHSAEVFLPSTATSCELPGLVLKRVEHSLDGFLACGGGCFGDIDPRTSCEEFSPATGTWALPNHPLQEERASHVSWSVEEGTLLMGGAFSWTPSAEIVKQDGITETSFEMKYDTKYETIQ